MRTLIEIRLIYTHLRLISEDELLIRIAEFRLDCYTEELAARELGPLNLECQCTI